jgi:MoaA/NifB/PqqE/SkfB family radical SAM enzyme
MQTTRSHTVSLLKKTFEQYDPHMARIFLSWACHNPRYIRSFIRLRRTNNKAKHKRMMERKQGLMVPPFLILSVTSRCNLSCDGCFACATGTVCFHSSSDDSNFPRVSIDGWRKIISEACDLGVFGFVIAGGEPFLYPEFLKLCSEFKDRFFIFLTNGTIPLTPYIKRLKRLGNIAILVSLEGDALLTNQRRGMHVYDRAIETMTMLQDIGVLCGISVTITQRNFRFWMDSKHIDNLINQGICIGVFIEYIPTTSDGQDHTLLLTEKERQAFRAHMLWYREHKNIYIVHSPGDEEFFGGCVSAGRGFAHVTPHGDLTPCPVSNIATHNLLRSSLRDALASPLFIKIRAQDHLLETEGLPCALFAHPQEVEAIARSVGAYRTDQY